MQSYKEELDRQMTDQMYIQQKLEVEKIMRAEFGAPIETLDGAQEHQIETINTLNKIREGVMEEVTTAQ